jgi:hypothetical protein
MIHKEELKTNLAIQAERWFKERHFKTAERRKTES